MDSALEVLSNLSVPHNEPDLCLCLKSVCCNFVHLQMDISHFHEMIRLRKCLKAFNNIIGFTELSMFFYILFFYYLLFDSPAALTLVEVVSKTRKMKKLGIVNDTENFDKFEYYLTYYNDAEVYIF